MVDTAQIEIDTLSRAIGALDASIRDITRLYRTTPSTSSSALALADAIDSPIDSSPTNKNIRNTAAELLRLVHSAKAVLRVRRLLIEGKFVKGGKLSRKILEVHQKVIAAAVSATASATDATIETTADATTDVTTGVTTDADTTATTDADATTPTSSGGLSNSFDAQTSFAALASTVEFGLNGDTYLIS